MKLEHWLESMLIFLRQVFERFRQYGLKFKPGKCDFFRFFLTLTLKDKGVLLTS